MSTNMHTTESSNASWQNMLFLKVRKCFWVAIALIAILLLASIVILSLQIVEYAQADNRAVALKTNMSDAIDVFSIHYENEQGDITVKGSNGEKVVAPGTDVSYTIRVRNADRFAIDYFLEPRLEFSSEYKLPLLVRIIDPDDNYILGSATEWATLEELNQVSHKGTLEKSESAEYVFQWMWPYEGEDDLFDTALGGSDVDIGLSVSFELGAVANTEINANGGLVPSGMAKNIGLLLAAIILSVVCVLLILSVIKRDKPVPVPVPEPVVIPEPEPEPVVITPPVILPVPAREAFSGKLAYINIDTLDEHFRSGETISLAILKEKHLVPGDTKRIKILARNGYSLNKAFIIQAQGISAAARSMILRAGGQVEITEG